MRTEIADMREALASYIEATYHLSHPKLVSLRHRLLMEGGIAQTPYIESTPTYVGDRAFSTLNLPQDIRDFLTDLASKDSGQLLFNPPYEHQAQALEATMRDDSGGTGIVVTTGTGSGKTESFLLPILARLADEAAHRPDRFATRAVRALLLYPMNALVNDQLGRLRTLFGSSAVRGWFTSSAGRPAKFGRYTGRTLYPGLRNGKRDQARLKTLEYYLKIEDSARAGNEGDQKLVRTLSGKGRWPSKPDSAVGAFDGLRDWYGNAGQHWSDANGDPLRANERAEDPELLTRHEIQEASPDLLVTNYSMLEYMLLRPIEREIFTDTRGFFEAHPDEKFFLILDESHLYRGANGTEVAYLIRRLLDRLGLPVDRVVFIATSASFTNPEAAKVFVAKLTGLTPASVTTLVGEKRAVTPAGPGPADLANAFAAVPLKALQSSVLGERSAVLTPIAKLAPNAVGAPVTLRRMDSGAKEIIASVHGLDPIGDRIEEQVLVPPGGSAQTEQPFLVVDGVSCSDGTVAVRRHYDLGTATPERFSPASDDLPAALNELLDGLPVIGRLRNITSGAVSPSDPVKAEGAAWAFSDLPPVLFPNSSGPIAVAAVDALLELASLAKPSPNDPPILPARIHMLFRGLPGLWACVNPDCNQVAEDERGGPTGRIYAEPRQNCDCGSQVYELHSCRSCGLAVARASIGAPAGTEHLWQDNGRAYAGETGLIEPVHVCLEDPMPQTANMVRANYLDLRSGRIDGAGQFAREVWLPPKLGPKQLFDNCPRCDAPCGDGQLNGISDLQTKGDQPFQELISVQVLEQPPRPQIQTALQGRKALVFSDGRQTASRLAGTLKTFSFRDSLRPLLLAGMASLKHPTYKASLDDAPLAVALGAAKHQVRLRPIGDDGGRMDWAGKEALRLVNDVDAESQDFSGLTGQTSEHHTPLSVFKSIYSVLQDNHTGLSPLALATLRPKLTKTDQRKLSEGLKLPTIPGLGDDEVRTALVELWLWQATRKHAIKLQHTDQTLVGAHGSSTIREWNGKFSRKIAKILEDRGLKVWLKGDYLETCEPTLREVFASGATGTYFIQAGKVALEISDKTEWIRCERCTAVSPRNPLLGDRCGYCTGTAKLIDPANDAVFRSRKAFYRRLWERLTDENDAYAPHQLVAEEHSAALNDSGQANAMSRNEAYELRFQDIPIEQDGQTSSPIDILSCTTTMEVGIDIGGLTAVSLRNVPPGRANYQQRAGRAGRRGAGLSTVVMFCGADSHDQSFFRDPAPIVAGPAPDPILNLNNPVIAKRQAFAYLIGRFQQDRIDTVGASSDVFSSLGGVTAFLTGARDVFSLVGFTQWIADHRGGLRADLDRLFTASCRTLDANELLNSFPNALEKALTQVPEAAPPPKMASVAESDNDTENEGMEDSADEDHRVNDNGKLLDRLFDAGLLPKYAFPTDVATFSVFEDGTDPWNPKRRYSPQQGLNAALSQYAPGREVWVDGKRYLSLGLYSERDEERVEAYRNRQLYFQCRVCNYADLLEWDKGHTEQTRDCPACSGRATLGPGRRWVRPTGFSHPPSVAANPPDFEPGMPLRPTRATLDALQFAPSAHIGGERWSIGTGWEGWSDSKTLVVTNRGSLSAAKPGFNYCTQCGRIEPAEFDQTLRQLGSGQPHNRPRPNRPKEPDQCSGQVAKIVLGNEFDTDVAVFRLALPRAWQLNPDRPSTTIAARSAVEALRRAACKLDDLEPNDIDGDFRFAPSDGTSQFIDLYLYDQATGGAGFVKAAARDPQRLVNVALDLLDQCNCDDSCYQCLRSYKNRYEHALFDRRIGADLLRACFKGKPLGIEPAREDYALDRLCNDLIESGAKVTRADGGLIDADGQVICLSHPFLETEPCSPRARALAEGKDTIAVDILLVLRALPIASNVALSVPNVDPTVGLKADPDGVPEVTPAMVVAGDLAPVGAVPRFTVAGAEPGDILFRLNANTLSGKNGDGAGGEVAKGTMCLFRPISGEPSSKDVYLVRRTDGKAFGATSDSWTVGIPQPVSNGGGVRVRYRASSKYDLECPSELIMAPDAVEPIALFVRALN
ncbi:MULTISPECIES: DEAD/DEAH box helicase [unclassified Mesorhizobium]|uniref:DEAD/DEAH box helicase n=1 Tax=unclassified Mesorhizobium TaxID=325217 RepID=UPI0004CDECF5|nr:MULTISPECIES: DEAD/DEAH box helicase [unclassified Mesorhizobium]WJI73785.1 DEAD/DEAH box helicase [Mesorhizobium sp. C395A]